MRFLVGIMAAAAFASAALAGPITYKFTVTGSGTIGSTNFTDAPMTFTIVGDTANVTGGTPLINVATSNPSYAIGGVGSGTFSNLLQVFDNQGGSALGMSTSPDGIDLLDLSNPAFATYALTTAIGPIAYASPFPVGQFQNIATSGGLLSLTSYSNATFTASTGAPTAAPEPGAVALLASALPLAAVTLRRRTKRSA